MGGGLERFLRSPLRIVLAVSLLTNAFFVFALIGRSMGDEAPADSRPFGIVRSADPGFAPPPDGRPPRARRGFIEMVHERASPGLQALIVEAQAEQTVDFATMRRDQMALRLERRQLMRQTPFDAARFQELSERSVRISFEMRRTGANAFNQVVLRATDEQRAELARVIEEVATARWGAWQPPSGE